MGIVNKVSYVDKIIANGEEQLRVGAFLDLMLDYDDKRFMNIPAPMIEEECMNFRDVCGVFVIADFETHTHKISNKLIYTNIDGKELNFGTLTDEEVEEINCWLLEYGEDEFEGAEVLDTHSEEEFNKTYNEYF